jgi:cell division protein FtsB
MPAASASAARAAKRPVVAQIRWDRLGRVAMLCVLVAIAYLYLNAALSLLSSWHESKRDSAQVVALERQGRVLMRKHAALVTQGAVQAQARKLGMIRPGEQAYVVSGLPNN